MIFFKCTHIKKIEDWVTELEDLVAELERGIEARKLVRFHVYYHSGIMCRHYDVWVDATATVKQLKQLLCEKVGIDDHEQAEMHSEDGEIIAEEGDLSEYKIYEGGSETHSTIIQLFPWKTQMIEW